MTAPRASSAPLRQSACCGAKSPSVIVLEITHSGRSAARHLRMPHGSPCSMTTASRVCFGLRAASSTHVLRIAPASLAVSWPARKSSSHRPHSSRRLPLPASGGTKPSATSTKKPEKPQPTGTCHSTSKGSGPKASADVELAWCASRGGVSTTRRLRSQMIKRRQSVRRA